MFTLGIETTCDETACAIVQGDRDILSNVIASQIDLHVEFGGVVPELSCRRHIEVLISVVDQALQDAGVNLTQIDLFSVARGPGLIGALLIGINAAKAFAWAEGKPIIAVNHVEAHLYAAYMSNAEQVVFPCIGVVISGGHTVLVYMKDVGSYELIGQTVDDAIGEAFDKVAKILGLPYPGGPYIEELAKQGDLHQFSFKAGHVKGSPLDFSFSGLKTAVLYASKGQSSSYHSPLMIEEKDKPHIAAAFQQAAFTDLVTKTLLAAKQRGCHSILFGGGVTCNLKLREMFNAADPSLNYFWPLKGLSLDNAAMIAGLGSKLYQQRGGDSLFEIEAAASLPFAL